jgi:hypothetical protein
MRKIEFKDKYLGRQMNKEQNRMVWTCLKNECRENSEEDFEHESRRNTPKRETEIKMGTGD